MARAADTKKTAAKAKRRIARPVSLSGLDARAVSALSAVDDSAQTQTDALAALDAIAAACAASVDGSVLAESVRLLRADRARAFAARHRKRVEAAIVAHELKGARAQEALVRALEECVSFLRAEHGVTGEVRTLELQLHDARRGAGGAPRPFFARFLETQRRA